MSMHPLFQQLLKPIAPKEDDEHECDDLEQADCDICSSCKEHTGFCSVCGLSGCCGAGQYDMG